MHGSGSGWRRTAALAASFLLGTAALAACGPGSSSSTSAATSNPTAVGSASGSPSSVPQLPPETMTFGVVGTPDEIAAYQQMAALFAPLNRRVTVHVESWPSTDAMIQAIRDGASVPDVFVASRRDLGYLQMHHKVQPIDQLLDDRGVDFGNDYPRGALTAFAQSNRLTCLPYGIEPSVILYNTRLVTFRRIHHDPPTPGQGWSLDQFSRAAKWAVSHHPGVTGAYVDPSMTGLGPFLYSGGGGLFDNNARPTSLAFSSGASQQALERLIHALRGPGMTLTRQQLDQQTPLEWFEQGKLALLEGTRQMVPALRLQRGFSFDVMPMPSLGAPATVGGLTGLCISQHARDTGTAADFLVYAASPPALGIVADAGYLQPANQAVALSDAFQQPGRLPRHASVFTYSVKSMLYPPAPAQWDQLDALIDPLLDRMMRGYASQVPHLTRRIDRISRPILAPVPSPSAPTSSAAGAGR